jgi:hypothetical protein
MSLPTEGREEWRKQGSEARRPVSTWRRLSKVSLGAMNKASSDRCLSAMQEVLMLDD